MPYDVEVQKWLFFTVGTSDGPSKTIEMLESEEIARTIRDSELPREMRPDRKDFERLGFKFEDMDDSILCKAKFPDGWYAKADEGYFTNIFDENGIRRGYYFYKGIFYDRRAYVALIRRYSIEVRDIDDDNNVVIVFIKDNKTGKVLIEFEPCQDVWSKEYSIELAKAELWLDEHFHNWRDVTAYWEEA